MKNLALLIAALLFAFGCGKSNDGDSHAEGDHQHAAAPSAEEGGASACEAAKKCCAAYVAELGGAVGADQACAGIQAAAEAGPRGEQSCKTMMQGWRTALSVANKNVPSDCAE